MCYTCGCKLPYDDHGDDQNLIEEDFEGAGHTQANGDRGIKKAKQNMLELLKLQEETDELIKPRKGYPG